MKRWFFIPLFFVFCLGACAPKPVTVATLSVAPSSASPTSPLSIKVLSVKPTPADLSPAQQAAVDSLSQSSNIPVEQIALVSSETVAWPNGCMGIRRIGVMCTPQEVPGFKIILEAQGKQYEFHTNQDGSVIFPTEPMQVVNIAQAAMVQQLAEKLGIQEGDIIVVSSATIQWQDSCLGVAIAGTDCIKGVIPGYLIVLEAGGVQYEYHTNYDGSQFVLVP